MLKVLADPAQPARAAHPDFLAAFPTKAILTIATIGRAAHDITAAIAVLTTEEEEVDTMTATHEVIKTDFGEGVVVIMAVTPVASCLFTAMTTTTL